MRKLPLRSALATAAVIITVSACGGSDADTASDAAASNAAPSAVPATDATPVEPTNGGTPTVNILNSRYDPIELDISAGETVTFTNSDKFAHTVTSKEGQDFEFDSGNFADGATFELTFDEAGTYAYFCEIHPTMRATINVI